MGTILRSPNLATFDSLAWDLVINHFQVAILRIRTIKECPRVLDIPEGDNKAIRNICKLSLSYDHRIVDCDSAGQFLKRLEQMPKEFAVF